MDVENCVLYAKRGTQHRHRNLDSCLRCNVDVAMVYTCWMKCRMSEREDGGRAVRRRSSASSAAAAGACSRSAGSWKKLRRPRDVRQFRDEYGDSVQRCTAARSLDDTIHTTLEQLRLIQDEDCCVVRCFNTTANGLVNRGDSFRRKNEPVLHSSSTCLLYTSPSPRDS